MSGHIRRRGERSWEIKFDTGRDPVTGKRAIRYQSFKGSKREAQAKLTELLSEAARGVLVEASKTTVVEYLRAWLDGPHGLAGKTAERYRELAERQIVPHLGSIALQKLRPAHIADWHAKVLREGGEGGRALSARTVGHAHRVLHRALARAAATELVPRNVVGIVKPPKVEDAEIESLRSDQITSRTQGHRRPCAAGYCRTGAKHRRPPRRDCWRLAWGTSISTRRHCGSNAASNRRAPG